VFRSTSTLADPNPNLNHNSNPNLNLNPNPNPNLNLNPNGKCGSIDTRVWKGRRFENILKLDRD
jgi:hypothetical protein